MQAAPIRAASRAERPSRPIAQWHPYGEFFASGSVDTNLKIWDIRKKSCIQTYRGHTKGVRQVRRRAPSLFEYCRDILIYRHDLRTQITFSPDGRWVLSGGDDGLVKLWDLTMGKLVHEFPQQQATHLSAMYSRPHIPASGL